MTLQHARYFPVFVQGKGVLGTKEESEKTSNMHLTWDKAHGNSSGRMNDLQWCHGFPQLASAEREWGLHTWRGDF